MAEVKQLLLTKRSRWMMEDRKVRGARSYKTLIWERSCDGQQIQPELSYKAGVSSLMLNM